MKWSLWHGNVFRARQTVDDLTADLADADASVESGKLAKAVREFRGYLAANASAIPNYRERHRADEIHLHLVRGIRGQPGHQQTHGQEAVDALESPRNASTAPDPHPVLNDTLAYDYRRWYPR